VVGWRLRQHEPEKLAQRKRIGGTPRDRALSVQALEIPDQQQTKVASRRQARPTVVRVEPLAQGFDVPVEVVLLKNLIQSRVERAQAPLPKPGSQRRGQCADHPWHQGVTQHREYLQLARDRRAWERVQP
jgi:hypothetical protein